MFPKTLTILEYDKIREKVTSLAHSDYGKEVVAGQNPLTNLREIERLQQETAEAVIYLDGGERLPFEGFYDIRDLIKRAVIGSTLAPLEIVEIGSTLQTARLVRQALTRGDLELELLGDLANPLAHFPLLEKEIARAVSPEGEVLDGASAKLHSLRGKLRIGQRRIREKLEAIVRSPDNAKYLQEQLITIRNDRYVIPVKQEYRPLFPGIVHDQSASGASLFIEPMNVVELNNELRLWETETEEEIQRILRELTGKIKLIADALRLTVTALASLDAIFARARYSKVIQGIRPKLNLESRINLIEARHPLLTGKVVPISINLGIDFDTLVITGPNTGGKTVSLKTLGLLTLMAQGGLQIPAAPESEIGIFSKVFCELGDEQSIEQSLSTFSSHMTQIIKILAAADGEDCLVLMDELGAGTDPTEGAALAMSILSHLHGLGVRTLATTHYSELKAFAYETPGIQNAAVEFSLETLQPTYRLTIGLPGSSQAFQIASKLGLPEFLIEHAKDYISVENAKVEEMLRAIEADRKQARDDRLLGEAARARGENYQSQYESELEKLQREKAAIIREAKAEARKMLLEARRESENLLRSIREAPPEELNQLVNDARKKLTTKLDNLDQELAGAREQKTPTTSISKETFQAGLRVKVKSLNQKGHIISVNRAEALVQLGVLKMNLPLSDLEIIAEQKVKVINQNRTSKAGLTTAQRVTTEISLRGLTVDEALYQLEKYLDQVVLAGLTKFRVIHGKGTGAVRQAVHNYLKGNPQIKAFYFAQQNEGGLGATVVEI